MSLDVMYGNWINGNFEQASFEMATQGGMAELSGPPDMGRATYNLLRDISKEMEEKRVMF